MVGIHVNICAQNKRLEIFMNKRVAKKIVKNKEVNSYNAGQVATAEKVLVKVAKKANK